MNAVSYFSMVCILKSFQIARKSFDLFSIQGRTSMSAVPPPYSTTATERHTKD